jgi:stage III sporulation protein SpoIIIAA
VAGIREFITVQLRIWRDPIGTLNPVAPTLVEVMGLPPEVQTAFDPFC